MSESGGTVHERDEVRLGWLAWLPVGAKPAVGGDAAGASGDHLMIIYGNGVAGGRPTDAASRL